MEKVVFVSEVPTLIDSYGGSIRNIPVYKPASIIMNQAIKRVNIDL